MSFINKEVTQERRMAKRLREHVDKYVEREELTDAQIAEKLDLLPFGAHNLFRQTWSLEKAIRVAEAFGFRMRMCLVWPDTEWPSTITVDTTEWTNDD